MAVAMGSKASTALTLFLLMLLRFASSDLNQDRAECADQLVGLATCLPYVSGGAKEPTIDCCSGLKQVLGKSKKCLCILIKDRDDPNLGLKINATLAAILPSACHAPANLSECITLLHLAPNSADAKAFEGLAKVAEAHSAGTPPAKGNTTISAPTANEKSDGGHGKRLLGVQMIHGLLPWFLITSCLIFHVV